MKKTILSLIAVFQLLSLFGQDVNSISIIPANPENTDFIKVVVNTSMNTTDCWITTSSVTTNGNNHSIIGAHCSGLLQQICTKSDTYNLGVLQVGTHYVSYDMFYGNLSAGQTQCTSFIFGDSLSTSFNVSNASGNLPVEIHPLGPHNICHGDSFYLFTDAFGQATYKWLLNGAEIYSGINHFIWAMDSGVYQVKAYANGDSGTSASVLINAFSPPTDHLTQTNNTLATDYASNSYQWYKNGSGPISGAITNEYEVLEDGEYFVELESPTGCIGYSDTIYVELIEAYIDPVDSSSACASDSITLTAYPNGTQYDYQWFRNGFALSGAIQSTLIPFITGEYEVIVSISQSTDTSDIHYSELNPGPTPTLTFDGANLFSTPAASYQWYKSGSGAIQGATDSLYTPTETGLYYVQVQDSMGCQGQSNGYAITTVGTEDLTTEQFIVIQQDGRLNIANNSSKAFAIRIVDLTGRQVFTSSANNGVLSIDISQWSSGIYFIQSQHNPSLTKKVIIP